MKFRYLSLLAAAAIALTACHEDPNGKDPDNNGTDPDVNPEIYAGGLLGTTFNSSASAFEDPTPAVEKAGLTDRFKYGEYFFERSYTQTAEPFDGLGPLYIRNSCSTSAIPVRPATPDTVTASVWNATAGTTGATAICW